jgi:UDP-N-acetylmuramate--alanine ligase
MPMFRGKARRIHFVGIGGIGMSGIAELLLNLGYEVSGSDLKRSEVTDRLEGLGAAIDYDHVGRRVDGADVVVRSSAVGDENAEVVRARRQGIPVIPRAEMLAELMRLKHGVAVGGSHGKTTTTSIVAQLLEAGGLDPTVVVGGKVNQLGTNARLGQGEVLVAEADESDGSFLVYSPTIAIVTNIDAEHLNHYGDMDGLREAFVRFVNRVPFYGLAVLCLDHPEVQNLLPRMDKRHVTYGMSSQADWQAADVTFDGLSTEFTVRFRGDELGRYRLPMIGAHNVLNALASLAVAEELGVPRDKARVALETFSGVQRRFTVRGEIGGVMVVDDYGHHPAEIRAVLAGARRAFDRRIVAVFQPHRYTRTRDCFDDFATAFNDADAVMVTDVYAAGEATIEGASGAALVEAITRRGHHDARHIADLDGAVHHLADASREGDVVITFGAGDIWRVGPALLAALGDRAGPPETGATEDDDENLAPVVPGPGRRGRKD